MTGQPSRRRWTSRAPRAGLSSSAGEAGIGKTSLVTSVCAARRGRASCGAPATRSITPRPLGPCATSRARSAARWRTCWKTPPRARRSSPPPWTSWPPAARCSSSRTCTGPTTRRSTSLTLLARRLERLRGCFVADLPDDELGARPPGAARAGDAAARVRAAGRAARRSRPARSPRSRERPAATRPSCTPSPAATRSSSPRRWPRAGGRRARQRARRGGARVARLARPARAVARAAPRWCPARPSCGWSRSAPAPRPRGRAACRRAAPPRAATRWPSATSWPARRSRSDPAAAPARAQRVVLRALEAAGGADPARLAHHAAARRRRGRDPAARAPRRAGSERGGRPPPRRCELWEAALAGERGDGDAARGALEGVAVEAYLSAAGSRAGGAARAARAARGGRRPRCARARPALALAHPVVVGPRRRAAEAGGRAIAVLERSPRAASWRWRSAPLPARDARRAQRRGDALGSAPSRSARARRRRDRGARADQRRHGAAGATTASAASRCSRALRSRSPGGHDDHAARAMVNCASFDAMGRRDDPRADAASTARCASRGSASSTATSQYLLGGARLLASARSTGRRRGRARGWLALGRHPGVALFPALLTIGRLGPRGEPAPRTLDEALRVAVATASCSACARPPAPAPRPRGSSRRGGGRGARARDLGDRASATSGTPASWRCGGCAPGERPPRAPAGSPRSRCRARRRRPRRVRALVGAGLPYEAAARCRAPRRAALDALAVFDGLGATARRRLRAPRLRRAGVSHVPRGPRPATRARPPG